MPLVSHTIYLLYKNFPTHMLTCSVKITLHHRLFATAARDKNKQGIIKMNKLCMHRKHYKHCKS